MTITDFYDSVNLAVDRVEITVQNIRLVEYLIMLPGSGFTEMNYYTKIFHRTMYHWKKYKYNNDEFYVIKPVDPTLGYSPRLILKHPSNVFRSFICTLFKTNAINYKVKQLEVAMDFVFKQQGEHEEYYNEATSKTTNYLNNSTYLMWGRSCTSFEYSDVPGYFETKYRANSKSKDKRGCSKPLTMYYKDVDGKKVLRYEIQLTSNIPFPFVLSKETMFKYIKFIKPEFNQVKWSKFLDTMTKRTASSKFKRLTDNFVNRKNLTINDKILRLRKAVKAVAPDYNCDNRVTACLEEDTELKSFILNTLTIKA